MLYGDRCGALLRLTLTADRRGANVSDGGRDRHWQRQSARQCVVAVLSMLSAWALGPCTATVGETIQRQRSCPLTRRRSRHCRSCPCVTDARRGRTGKKLLPSLALRLCTAVFDGGCVTHRSHKAHRASRGCTALHMTLV